MHARKIGDINSQMNRRARTVPSNGIVALAFVDPVRRLSMMGLPNVNTDIDFCTYGNGGHGTGNEESRVRRELVAVGRLIVLVVVFCCTWCPFVSIEIRSYHYTDLTLLQPKEQLAWKTGLCLMAFHCTINPVLYALNSRRFRTFVLNLCDCDGTQVIDLRDGNAKLVSTISFRRHTGIDNDIRMQGNANRWLRVSKQLANKPNNCFLPSLEEIPMETLGDKKNINLQNDKINKEEHNDRRIINRSHTVASLSSFDEGVYLDEDSPPVKNVS